MQVTNRIKKFFCPVNLLRHNCYYQLLELAPLYGGGYTGAGLLGVSPVLSQRCRGKLTEPTIKNHVLILNKNTHANTVHGTSEAAAGRVFNISSFPTKKLD